MMWFDMWRFVDGKADEHWDYGTIAPPRGGAAGAGGAPAGRPWSWWPSERRRSASIVTAARSRFLRLCEGDFKAASFRDLLRNLDRPLS